MKIFEIAVSFSIGLLLILLLGWVFRLKTKGLKRIIINTLCGGVIFCLLPLFKVVSVAINPLNALITGFLGVPGLIAVVLLSVFL